LVGAPILALAVAAVAFGPPLAPPRSPPEVPFGGGAPTAAAALTAALGVPRDPEELIRIPVETDPPGATVLLASGWNHSVLCAPTPCTFTMPRADAETAVVSIQLVGRTSVQAHVKDVAAVPGGVLTLTFGPRGVAPSLTQGVRSVMLRQGAVVVRGGLPTEVVQRIVRQNFGRLRLCYEDGLRTHPDLTGRVATRFVIDRSGAVALAADGGSDLPDQSVVSCVVRSFGTLTFPEPEGSVVQVVYPVIFVPG
jgi:hypothetical protein